MKFRIHKNSVRVRLTQSEVARLAKGQSVEQVTPFSPTAQLVSTVRTSPEASTPTASFDATGLTVWLPAEQATQWASTDEVGIYADVDAGRGHSLRLLVEKDFECLHRDPWEEVGDAFPNPHALNEA